MAVSSQLMLEVNENDAKAALRNWMQTLADHAQVAVDPDVPTLSGAEALTRAFRDKQIDCATLTTKNLLTVEREVSLTNLLAERGAEAGDVYLLLVHEASGITNIADLKGRELLVSETMRMSLALPWLDVILMRQGLYRASDHFGAFTRAKKLAKIILPVFFRTSDVCLVPRRGFESMVELNPQVGKQLRILAQSPHYVGGLVCFRGDYPAAQLEKVTAGILGFQRTTRGRQVLTIFQADPVDWLPRTTLNSAVELLAEHKRLCASNNPADIAVKALIPSATQR